MNLQKEILQILSQNDAIAPAELIKKIQEKHPDAATSDIKLAMSPLLSTGDIEFSSDRKLKRVAVVAA
jgi:hypothetical protein